MSNYLPFINKFISRREPTRVDPFSIQGVNLSEELGQIIADEGLNSEIKKFNKKGRDSNSISNFSDSDNSQKQFYRQNLHNITLRTPTTKKHLLKKSRKRDTEFSSRGISLRNSSVIHLNEEHQILRPAQMLDNNHSLRKIRKEIREDKAGFLNTPKVKKCKYNRTQIVRKRDIYDCGSSSCSSEHAESTPPNLQEILNDIAKTDFEPNPQELKNNLSQLFSPNNETPEKTARQLYLDSKFGASRRNLVRNLSLKSVQSNKISKCESMLKAPKKSRSFISVRSLEEIHYNNTNLKSHTKVEGMTSLSDIFIKSDYSFRCSGFHITSQEADLSYQCSQKSLDEKVQESTNPFMRTPDIKDKLSALNLCE